MSDRGARRWRLVRAAPAAIPASVRRFNQRARARRVAVAKPWLIAAATLAFGGVASWIVFGTSVLGVDRITVKGGGFVSEDAVREAAGVSLGTPMLTVNLGATAHRVEALAAVSKATVTREWPTTLVIDVTLRTALAAVPLAENRFVLVDANGVAFRTVDSAGGLPLIVTSSTNLTDHATAAALDAGARVLASLPADLTAQLVRIEAQSDTEVELVLQNGRTVIWGDDTDNEQKARVALSMLAQPGAVIDVSAPTLVTVR
jgi:cell division protein FtsQ